MNVQIKKELVSIIIAAYNAEKYIDNCMECLLAQTYSNIEVLICNDSSTDKTLEKLKKIAITDSRVKILENISNIKAGASRNRCIEHCTGQYIMIQDADDVCENNRVEILLETLLESPDIDFVSSGYYLFDDNGIYKTEVLQNGYPSNKDFLYGIPFCHAATMFRKKCLVSVNGYRVCKETRRGQDYDLFMRLYAKGYRGLNIPDVLYGYRVDQNAVARRKFKYRIDECIIRYKGFKLLGLFPLGIPYVFKPILAHIVQYLKNIKKE